MDLREKLRLDFVTWVCVVMAEPTTIVGGVVNGVKSIWSLLEWGSATINYKPKLERIKERLNSVAKVVQQRKENLSEEEVRLLENLLEEAQELVGQFSSSSKWGPLRILFYTSNLEELMEKVAVLTSHCNLQLADRNSLEQHQVSGLHGAPLEPECIGMGEPLNWLRINLLNDDVSVIVLIGLGGSGKSTLAKKICRDTEITSKLPSLSSSHTPNMKHYNPVFIREQKKQH